MKLRKKITITSAAVLISLTTLVTAGQAATLSLPDPTKSYGTELGTLTGGYQYVSWAHDDFWSYSSRFITLAQNNNIISPSLGDYKVITGTGQLGVIMADSSGHDNPGTFEDAYKLTGSKPYYDAIWGLGANGGQGSSGPVTVGMVKGFLQAGGNNSNIPVFGMDMQTAQNHPDFAFRAHVYLTASDYAHRVVEWAFDETAQGAGNSGIRGTLDADAPGFSQTGTYDPNSYATARAFNGGGGQLDYIAYAPTMDLSKYDDELKFVVELEMGMADKNDPLSLQGNPEFFLLNNIKPYAPVPEPGSFALVGAGLLGLAIYGKRRMGHKKD